MNYCNCVLRKKIIVQVSERKILTFVENIHFKNEIFSSIKKKLALFGCKITREWKIYELEGKINKLDPFSSKIRAN